MKKYDIILIASLLVIGLLSMYAVSVINNEDISKVAVLQVDKHVIDKIPISNSKEEKTVAFDFSGNTGYIQIKDGAVRIVEMERTICPQKICSETGWISKPYQTIVCLPNRIVVSIENSENYEADSSVVDGLSY